MAEDDRFLSLGIDINQSLIRRSQRGLSDLRDETIKLARTQADSAQASRKEESALGDIDRLRKQIVRSQELRIDALRLEARRQLELADAIKQSVREQSASSAAFEAFRQDNNQIRRSTQGLRDIDIALSSLGAGNVGQIFNAAEGAARLASSSRGLPTTLAETASGLLGVEVTAGAAAAGAGVLAAALIGVEVAHKAYTRQVKESLEDYQVALDAQRLYTEAVVSGTQESIDVQLASLKPLLEARQLEVDIVRQQREEQTSLAAVMQQLANIDVRSPIQAIVEMIAIIDAAIRQRNTLRKQLDSAEDEAQQAANSISRLNQAYNDERVVRRSAAEATQDTSSALKEASQAFLDGRISLEQYQKAQEASLTTTQRAQRQAQELSRQQQQAEKTLQKSQRAEEERTAAIEKSTIAVRESRVAIGQLAADRYRQQAEIAVDANKQILEVRQEGAEAVAELFRDSRLDAAKLKRKLTEDIAELRRRAEFDEFDLTLDRDFAGIASGRRQVQFDIAEARRQSAFDRREQLIDRGVRMEELRLNINQKIADIEQQRLKAQQQAFQETINAMLKARGLFVPAGFSLQRQIDASVNRAIGETFG